MLIEKNKVMNLTTITEYEEVIEKHFLDSISLCKVYDLSKSVKVLDMGTGAGFPGIPLKIAFPEIEITLADSLNKRIKFLDEVIEKLELKKVKTIHARAEELARNKGYRESYDLVVSRAVANLSTLGEYCIPFVKKGGYIYIVIPGMVKDCHDNLPKELLLSWTPEQLEYMHDIEYWRDIVSKSKMSEIISITETEGNEECWNDWLKCDNEYAINDRKAMEAGGGKNLNFIAIILRKK